MTNSDVSIVLACYNEGEILEESVNEICEFMDVTKYSYELIMIDDKSKDSTPQTIQELAKKNKKISVVLHEENVGRGGTVSEGIFLAKAPIVGYIDVDLETPAHYMLPLIMAVEKGSDIATGVRIYRLGLSYLHRVILSKAYGFLVRFLLGLNLKDTEAGCKFFKRESIFPILKETKDKEWFWDTEVLTRAYYKRLGIKEIPVYFQKKPYVRSTVKIFSDTWKYFKNLMSFRAVVKKLKEKKLGVRK